MLIDTGEPMIGTCLTMCPYSEMKYRQESKNLVFFERVIGTESDHHPQTNENLCVKEFKKIGSYKHNSLSLYSFFSSYSSLSIINMDRCDCKSNSRSY
jgi:hypothetical protein